MDSKTTSGLLITLIAVACLVIIVILFNRALKQAGAGNNQRKKIITRTGLFFVVWMAILGVLSASGVFIAASLPPRPMFTAIIGILILFGLSYTKTLRQALIAAPLHWLLFFQSFRIAVELWFWYSAHNGVFPSIMTFEGENFDILAGTLGIVAGLIVWRLPQRGRPVAIIYNIIGFLILGKTLFTAAASMPSSIQRYPFDERLLQLGEFPFIYLPGVLVVLALGCHLLSLRQVYLKKKERVEVNQATIKVTMAK